MNAGAALFEEAWSREGELRHSCDILHSTGCRWLFPQLAPTPASEPLHLLCPLPGTLFFHMLTWFFPSFPSGFFSNVTLSERSSLAIQYKTAVPWPQGPHPLPVTLLRCFPPHPAYPILTCVLVSLR